MAEEIKIVKKNVLQTAMDWLILLFLIAVVISIFKDDEYCVGVNNEPACILGVSLGSMQEGFLQGYTQVKEK